jgi:hypothetical protein
MINRNIDFVKTKEKLNDQELFSVKVENKFIHSAYYPLKESEKFVESLNLNNKKRIALYGLGLGYHIYYMINRYPDIEIHVFDLSKDLLSYALEKSVFPINNIVSKENINIAVKEPDKEFYENFIKSIEWCDSFVIYEPALKIIPKEYSEFREVLLEYRAQKITEENNIKLLKENAEKNKTIEDKKKLKDFYMDYNLKDKNVIVVSAGPSLNYAMEELIELKKHSDVFIICVGTALRALINNGITPDAFCVLDPLHHIYNQIVGLEDIGIPMCFLYTSNHEAALNYRGNKYIFYNNLKEDDFMIDCGNSVATAALSLAINGKPKRIVLIGQDLAYIDNKRHVDNTVYGEQHIYNINKNDFLSESVDGSKLYTNKFFYDTKRWIERYVKNFKNIKFINCSLGLNIEGFNNLNVNELKEKIKNG